MMDVLSKHTKPLRVDPPVHKHKHLYRVQGRTVMGWQYVFVCDCGQHRFPDVSLFGAVRVPPAGMRTKTDCR